MNLTLPRAICFDLDGTLVDSVSDLTVACNLMLAERGVDPLREETVRGYIGDGARMLVARALGEAPAEVDSALLRFRDFYAEHLLDHTHAYPGVEVTLAALQERGNAHGRGEQQTPRIQRESRGGSRAWRVLRRDRGSARGECR